MGEGVELEPLDELAAALARAFLVSCHVAQRRSTRPSPSTSCADNTIQPLILEQLSRVTDGQTRLLGVTELDLFVPVLTFVFGEAQLRRPLRPDLAAPAARGVLRPAAESRSLCGSAPVKEAVHELGHTFGLRHCPDWRCVMASTHAVERLDLKSADFCARCAKIVSAGG